MPQLDELSGAERSKREPGGRPPSRRAVAILVVVLCLGLPVSYLASWYSHRQEHHWVAPTDQQYQGYLAGFAFAREHPMAADDVANVDYCDAAAHRLNRTARNWLYFSRGCQDATGWTPGDGPLRPITKAVFLAPPR
jgi:hypothetical protein